MGRPAKNAGRTIKRAIDFSAATVLLLLLSPIMLAICLAVALTLGRPVLFKQIRPGLNGRLFTMYGFPNHEKPV